MNDSLTLHLKASVGSYLALVGTTSIPLIIIVIALVSRGFMDLKALLAALILPVGFFVWLWAFRIDVKEGVLTYRTLTSRRRVRVADIESSRIESGVSYKSEGLVRLVVVPTMESGAETFSINLKPFSLVALRKLYPVVKLDLKRNRR